MMCFFSDQGLFDLWLCKASGKARPQVDWNLGLRMTWMILHFLNYLSILNDHVFTQYFIYIYLLTSLSPGIILHIWPITFPKNSDAYSPPARTGSTSQTLHLHGRLLIKQLTRRLHVARILRKSGAGLRLSLLQHLAGMIGLALRKEEK